jgi:hypothetical protein
MSPTDVRSRTSGTPRHGLPILDQPCASVPLIDTATGFSIPSKKCQPQFNKRTTIIRSDRGSRRSSTLVVPHRPSPLDFAPLRTTLLSWPRTEAVFHINIFHVLLRCSVDPIWEYTYPPHDIVPVRNTLGGTHLSCALSQPPHLSTDPDTEPAAQVMQYGHPITVVVATCCAEHKVDQSDGLGRDNLLAARQGGFWTTNTQVLLYYELCSGIL